MVAREDTLLIRPHEWKKPHLIHRASEKRINQKQAVELTSLSERQMRWLMKPIRKEGDRRSCTADEVSLPTGAGPRK
jgi:hypothetical protein